MSVLIGPALLGEGGLSEVFLPYLTRPLPDAVPSLPPSLPVPLVSPSSLFDTPPPLGNTTKGD